MKRGVSIVALFGAVSLGGVSLGACDRGEEAPVPQAPSPSTAAQSDDAAPTARPGGQIAPENRTFREWHAACDNGAACVAYAGADAGGWIRVSMDAGPDARPSISVGMPAADGADGGSGVTLVVDGRAVETRPGPAGAYRNDIPAGQVDDVLRRLAAARSLALRGAGQTVEVPASGLSAALLWIDERQGRLDTVTALIRRGRQPASDVPAAPALSQVVAAQAVAQGDLAGANDPGEQGAEAGLTLPASIEALAEVRRCREETSYNEYLQRALLAGRLSAEVELWGVPCGAGAYNATYRLYLTGPGGTRPREAVFPGWDGQPQGGVEGDISGDGLTNPVFEPQRNRITHFPRGRGLGDCGVIQSWAWTGRGFVLTEERSMGECWGMIPDLWPATWRTR